MNLDAIHRPKASHKLTVLNCACMFKSVIISRDRNLVPQLQVIRDHIRSLPSAAMLFHFAIERPLYDFFPDNSGFLIIESDDEGRAWTDWKREMLERRSRDLVHTYTGMEVCWKIFRRPEIEEDMPY